MGKDKNKRNSTLLMLVIFAAYIGLGIPDSLFGSAWPAIYQDLNLPVSYASFVTTIISFGTIASSFMSGRVVKKFGTANVAVVSTIMTAAALIGFSFSKNIIFFCLLAVPLGFGAGSIDAGLNNYVALNYNAFAMNLLHCFYGVGVSLSPYLMSLALSKNNDWRLGYRFNFAIQLCIALLLLVSLPLWKRVKSNDEQKTIEMKTLTVFQALKMKKTKSAIGVFMGSCGIEAICLVWASTFLVQTKNFATDKAAGVVTIYFVGLTLGRFFSGLLSKKLSSEKIIIMGQAVTLVAIILLLLSLPTAFVYVGLFLVGLGNGPLFPNMTHLTPIIFGEEYSQSMIGIEMGFAYVSFLCVPLIFGQLARYIGSFLFPYCLLVLFGIMFVSTIILFKNDTVKKI